MTLSPRWHLQNWNKTNLLVPLINIQLHNSSLRCLDQSKLVLCGSMSFCTIFVLLVVKNIKLWVCKLPKDLLLVANEQLLRSPKPPKALFLQNFNYSFNHPFTTLLLSFWYFFNLYRVWIFLLQTQHFDHPIEPGVVFH